MTRFRGQALLEFMLLLAIMTVYLVVLSLVYGSQNAYQFRFTEMALGKVTADSVAMAANEAFIGGNGSNVTATVKNATKSISVISNFVQVARYDALVDSPLQT